MVGKTISDLPLDGAADISAELLKLTSNAGISFEISAAFSHLQKQQEYASKAHEYTRLEIDGVAERGVRNSHARLSISSATEVEAQFFKTRRLSISSVSKLSDGENNIPHRRRLSSVCDDFPPAIPQSAISAESMVFMQNLKASEGIPTMEDLRFCADSCSEAELQSMARQSIRDPRNSRADKMLQHQMLGHTSKSKGSLKETNSESKGLSKQLQDVELGPSKEGRPRPDHNSAMEQIQNKIRGRSPFGFDGPAVRYPLITRTELLTAQAIDSLQSAAPYRTRNADEGRRGGLRTSFIDGFTSCPTRHSACGLRLRIEAAAASVARGRYDDPHTLRLVGGGGVGSVVDPARPGRSPDRSDEISGNGREGGRPAFRVASRLSTAEEIKRGVARETAAGVGPWRSTPDLYPSLLTSVDRRYCFRPEGPPPGAGAGGGGRDFWLPTSPSRPPGAQTPLGWAAPLSAIGAGPGEGRAGDSTRDQLARGVGIVDGAGLRFRLETPGLRPPPGGRYLREAETMSRRY